MKHREDFLKPTQGELFSRLCKMFPTALTNRGSYILVPGEAPVMLVAHLDTVHTQPVRQICKTANGNVLMSPQGIGGDDRCGVYALVTAHSRSSKRPWLLFTCDEETGGVGAGKFCKDYRADWLPRELGKLKMLIEIDRKGRNDAVYYGCCNTDFEQYISEKGFTTQHGSFSDISLIAPTLGVAAVNLSSGYFNAHTLHEYINRKYLNLTIKRVVEIIEEATNEDFPAYSYIEKEKDVWWGAGMLWERDSQDDVLEYVPEEIRYEYETLLDLYNPEELEAARAEYGDWAIRSMYESEFGGYYADIPTPDELEDDAPDICIRLKGDRK